MKAFEISVTRKLFKTALNWESQSLEFQSAFKFQLKAHQNLDHFKKRRLSIYLDIFIDYWHSSIDLFTLPIIHYRLTKTLTSSPTHVMYIYIILISNCIICTALYLRIYTLILL